MDTAASLNDEAPAWDWAAVLEKNRPRLLAILEARLRDRHSAEDVLQMVALAVTRAKHPPPSEGETVPWLYRIAIRQCLFYRRTAGRQARLTQNYARHARGREERPDCDPLQWLLAEERRRLFHEALGRLPDLDRQILVLKCFEGWTYQQLAACLGVSERAVEHRLCRARQRLRSLLADDTTGGTP